MVRYFISNGTRSGVQGEVVVSQEPRPADNTPVTETDRVTVRAGAGVAVPVLDNDFSPSGDTLSLVPDVAGEKPGQLSVLRPGDEKVPTGQAFVAGRFVRYVAPAELEDAQTYQVRYLATNAQGDTAPGRIEISVVPLDRPNQPPEPPVLEGRAVSGDTLKLKLPGAGVDPDGDSVTLLGLGSAPRLGRLVRFGANSMHYQAYPDSVGTDEFSYQVTDPFGEVATGTVRVAIVPPGPPQPPLAVDDSFTVEPGRRAIVDVLANDLIAAGDRVSVELVDPPEGVSLESDTGPVLIDAPDRVDGRNVEVVYAISNGIAESLGTVTLRTAKPFNNPPVVFDAFGENEEGDSVTVDVLATAYDPDGSADDLEITDVFAPPGVRASVDDARITVARGEQPIVVPVPRRGRRRWRRHGVALRARDREWPAVRRRRRHHPPRPGRVEEARPVRLRRQPGRRPGQLHVEGPDLGVAGRQSDRAGRGRGPVHGQGRRRLHRPGCGDLRGHHRRLGRRRRRRPGGARGPGPGRRSRAHPALPDRPGGGGPGRVGRARHRDALPRLDRRPRGRGQPRVRRRVVAGARRTVHRGGPGPPGRGGSER